MRRSIIAFFTCVLLICSGCIPHQGGRPFDYPSAKWVSETPNLWFIVDSPYDDATKTVELKGQLELAGQSVEIIVAFDYNVSVYIREKTDDEDNACLKGTCKFSPEKLIVTVNKKTDTLLNGQYDTIIFIRTSLE